MPAQRGKSKKISPDKSTEILEAVRVATAVIGDRMDATRSDYQQLSNKDLLRSIKEQMKLFDLLVFFVAGGTQQYAQKSSIRRGRIKHEASILGRELNVDPSRIEELYLTLLSKYLYCRP